ncbi:hypothetical protein COCMIDRAFT_96770 [Bipolaris oryzae ATCC 44560]|uniref:Uncharacterized protein n=1 Tax=Bipolaris oryzae ATCC 44560 TaxID=930090 RepID=W6Z025_COCMI|nr:uncharacterized protein COCMIDRAFT_96770 [Bipolaris oryzae ATCC 44560]EUC44977.1 hypothetical protein COCMIDRAFT_96770 [Bipolaris oryzae ATCC 44560]
MPPKAKPRAGKQTNNVAKKAIPPPFTPTPPALENLLYTFDRSLVYVTHVDPHPAWFKRRIFIVPLLLNASFVLVLLWRLYTIGPHYLDIVKSVLGQANHTTIYWASNTWGSLLWKVGRRMLLFLFDFFLFRIVGPWPWSFFVEQPGNPVSWRWNVGFRDQEIYVRVSRGWSAKDLLGEAEGSSGRRGGESPFFKTRILPAVDKQRLREKTGYMLMDADFDLDFFGMVAATQLLDRKDITLDHVRKSVFVYVGDAERDNGQWAVWDCAKLDEGSETEAREKVVAFKDKLTAMGKESLFFRWVELIQYESSAPGGFTPERQAAAAEKVKQMFEDQGVDFEQFSREIGGLDGMTDI